MATEDPAYTQETANGARLQALLIDEGTKLVRKVFDQEVSNMNPPPSLQVLLRNNKHNLHNEVLERLGSLEKKVEEGKKDILDGQKAIITEVEKQSRSSDTEDNQEDKTPIQDNPNTDEQVADGVRGLTLGDSETEQGNVVGQPSSVEATIHQPRSSGTDNSDNISEVDGKKYDFGILCTKADESWTKTDIVHKLEQKKLKGYFPCRDDIGGDSVFQYLSNGIEKSRNVIIVYSPATISDEWFKMGYQTAVVEKLDKNLIGRVIPVIRNGFTGDKLPIELKTIIPLEGDNPDFFERLEKCLIF
ncbi:hypothetical protein Bbelb_077850 [Branchiostoma belcheri]|nr:hypothetical protein Bbelb_077850 [Branchiostoma belcheri]